MGKLSGRSLDALGLGVLGGAAAWISWVAARSGAHPGGALALLAASGAALVAGRFVARRARWMPAAALAALAAVIAVMSPAEVLSGAPLSGPFGYANATGAFFAQAAIAALMVAASGRALGIRILGVALAGALVAVPWMIGSLAPALLATLLPALALLASAAFRPRAGVAVCGALFVISLAGTLTIAARFDRLEAEADPSQSLRTGRREALWSDAVTIIRSHPLSGVGPGGFALASPTARSDEDARWAHHEFLQMGAETGVVGLVLLVLLFILGFVRLSTTPAPDAVTVLGAASLAALGIHACLDYILHFPAVPVGAAAVLAAAIESPRDDA